MVALKRVLPVLVLTMAALPACADTLNVVGNGSIGSFVGGNGFYMATYADSSTLQAFGSLQTNSFSWALELPDITLPTGAVVTSATFNVGFDPLVQVTTAGTYSQAPQPIDPSNSFVPGEINVTTSTTTMLDSLLVHSPTTNAGCQLNNPGSSTNLLAAGFGSCLVGTNDYKLDLSLTTTLMGELVSSGYNSGEIFNFEGENTVDVSEDLSIDYTVTPEPSGMVLLATGMLALMATAWYRRAANC
jgi:hypothetical protein